RFDSGALAMIEGPATFAAEGVKRLQRRSGMLAARVPPRAVGSVVSPRMVGVNDMGTEFSVQAEEAETEVQVVAGSVEVQRRDNGGGEFARVLSAGEAVRFGNSTSQGFYVQETEMNKTIFLGMVAMLATPSAVA